MQLIQSVEEGIDLLFAAFTAALVVSRFRIADKFMATTRKPHWIDHLPFAAALAVIVYQTVCKPTSIDAVLYFVCLMAAFFTRRPSMRILSFIILQVTGLWIAGHVLTSKGVTLYVSLDVGPNSKPDYLRLLVLWAPVLATATLAMFFILVIGRSVYILISKQT
jgi:hypothetical protein